MLGPPQMKAGMFSDAPFCSAWGSGSGSSSNTPSTGVAWACLRAASALRSGTFSPSMTAFALAALSSALAIRSLMRSSR